MNTQIKELRLINFKGQRDLQIPFNTDGQTDISGANGSGKTTIFDAWTWLLFGKDSQDRKDFDIKTLDATNKVIPKIDHEVRGLIVHGEKEIRLSKVLREKWVKSKGEELPTYQGNETTYMIDDLPMTMAEYQKRVDDIIPERRFKMLSNPRFFNEILTWKERRQSLTSIASIPTDQEILLSITTEKNAEALRQISEFLKSGEELDKLRQKYAQQKKGIKDELRQIPSRIDEVRRAMPNDLQDFEFMEEEKQRLSQELRDLDAQLLDRSKTVQKLIDERSKKIQQRDAFQQTMTSRRQAIQNEVNERSKQRLQKPQELQNQRQRLESQMLQILNDIDMEAKRLQGEQVEIEDMRQKNARLSEEWDQLNASQFIWSTDSLCCPTCGQQLPEDNIANQRETARQAFNAEKSEKMQAINRKGVSNKTLIEQLENIMANREKNILALRGNQDDLKFQISEIDLELEKLENQTSEDWPTVEELLEADKQYQLALQDYNAVEISDIEQPSNDDLLQEKSECQRSLDILTTQLADRDALQRGQDRLTELSDQESNLAQNLADLERMEFQIEEFVRVKSDKIEQAVNTMFPTIRWKLFDQLIDGQVECCEATVNGVPYSVRSNAEKINAGVEVINVFSQYLDTYCPIFVDNAESINILPATRSQLIRLLVTEDAQLTIRA